jgi:hypothetical protein
MAFHHGHARAARAESRRLRARSIAICARDGLLLLPLEALHRVSHLAGQHEMLACHARRPPPPGRRIPLPGRLVPLPGCLRPAGTGYPPGPAVDGPGDGLLRPAVEPPERQPARSEQPLEQGFPGAGGLLALIGERLARVGGLVARIGGAVS